MRRHPRPGTTRGVHILVASVNDETKKEIANLVTNVAQSNVPFGLPAIAVSIFGACSAAEVRATLARNEATPPIALALLSESVLDDFTSLRDEGQPTTFLVFNDDGPSTYDSATLARSFGVIDVLPYPRTAEESARQAQANIDRPVPSVARMPF